MGAHNTGAEAVLVGILQNKHQRGRTASQEMKVSYEPQKQESHKVPAKSFARCFRTR